MCVPADPPEEFPFPFFAYASLLLSWRQGALKDFNGCPGFGIGLLQRLLHIGQSLLYPTPRSALAAHMHTQKQPCCSFWCHGTNAKKCKMLVAMQRV
jgi:hypothetical protein